MDCGTGGVTVEYWAVVNGPRLALALGYTYVDSGPHRDEVARYLLPVYLVIRTMGGAYVSSKHQAASGQDAASCSKQATSPSGSLAGPEWTRNRNPPLGFRCPPDGSWDPKQPSEGPGIPVSRPRWASARPNGPGPKRARAAIPGQYHQKQGPAARRRALGLHCPRSWTESTRAPFGLSFCRFLTYFWPQMAQDRARRCKTKKNGRISGYVPNRDSEGTFSPYQPSFWVVAITQNGPNTPPDAAFARRVSVLPCFCLHAPTKKGSQMGPKWVKSDFIQK